MKFKFNIEIDLRHYFQKIKTNKNGRWMFSI